MSIPKGYQRVMPYIILDGAAQFLEFTKAVFGATEKLRMMRDEKIIQHAEIAIGESVIMFADSVEDYPASAGSFFIYVPNADETYEKALEYGATSVAPPADKEYGRSGGIKDPCGNTWWVTSENK